MELDGGVAISASVNPSDMAAGIRLSVVALALDTAGAGLVLPTM